MNPNSIIIEPILTDKSHRQLELNKYTVKVAQNANKKQVIFAMKQLFNVTAIKCNVINVGGKPKRGTRGIRPGYTNKWKKMIITLKKGDKLDFFQAI